MTHGDVPWFTVPMTFVVSAANVAWTAKVPTFVTVPEGRDARETGWVACQNVPETGWVAWKNAPVTATDPVIVVLVRVTGWVAGKFDTATIPETGCVCADPSTSCVSAGLVRVDNSTSKFGRFGWETGCICEFTIDAYTNPKVSDIDPENGAKKVSVMVNPLGTTDKMFAETSSPV